MNSQPVNRRMALLIPCSFFVNLALGIISFSMLFIVKERFGADAQTVGWFTALCPMTYFVGCTFINKIANSIGPRISMAIMLLGTSAAFGLFLILPSLVSAFIIYGLYGFLTAFFWPPLMAWLSAGLEGQALGKTMATFNLSWSSSGIFAPYIGGLLFELNFDLPILIGIGIFAVMGILVLATRAAVPTPPSGGEKP